MLRVIMSVDMTTVRHIGRYRYMLERFPNLLKADKRANGETKSDRKVFQDICYEGKRLTARKSKSLPINHRPRLHLQSFLKGS